MEYEIVERDFVIRSLSILQQYEQHVKPSTPTDKHFEVTLLLNCLLGLLILPFEHLKRKQNNIEFPQICKEDDTPINKLDSKWGLNELLVSKIVLRGNALSHKDTTLRIVVAMFRHGMAHALFGDGNKKPLGLSYNYRGAINNSSESVIYEINLINKYRETEFIASIPVEYLKKFVIRFASTFLRENFNIDFS